MTSQMIGMDMVYGKKNKIKNIKIKTGSWRVYKSEVALLIKKKILCDALMTSGVVKLNVCCLWR